MVKILQYNCQGLLYNKDRITYHLINNNVDIAIFAEIFRWDNSNKITNYNIASKARSDGFGGVAIVLKKSINFRKVKYQTNQEIIIIETTNLKPNLKIAAVYFPPNRIRQSTFDAEVKKLFNFFENEDNVLIAGDFNARNSHYGDSATLPRGIKLKNLVYTSQFRVLKDGTPTFNRFHDHSKHYSVLDITLTNTTHNWIWTPSNIYLSGSHHKPIEIEINDAQIEEREFICSKKIMSVISMK